MILILKKNWIPIILGYLVLSLVEISQVVLKKIFKFIRCIFAISLLSPLWKGHGSSFEATWIPFTQGCLMPSLVEIGLVILEKLKMWKVNRQMYRWIENRQSEKLTLSFHSGELKNKTSPHQKLYWNTVQFFLPMRVLYIRDPWLWPHQPPLPRPPSTSWSSPLELLRQPLSSRLLSLCFCRKWKLAWLWHLGFELSPT